MESTTNLSLPYIMPSQAQKHVTHNEALRRLDALTQLAVLDRDLATPPASPAEGDRFIVGAGATGAWTGEDGRIAAWQDGAWSFLAPRPGWLALVLDEERLLWWDGSAWLGVVGGVAALQDLALLGVGTTADSENPFSAKLNKALWSAIGSGEGGTGDLRYTLNKEGPASVLSLLMQSGWSGRAEIGLVGNDDLTFKVSADGSDWKQVLTADRATGKVGFPHTNLLTDFSVSLLPDSGRFAGNAAKSNTISAYSFPSYLSLYNGSGQASAGKFITNNTDYGGSAGSLPADVKALIDWIRDQRRHGVEFFLAEITMGSGTVTSRTVGGVTYHYSLYTTHGPRPPAMTFHCYLKALDDPIIYSRHDGQSILPVVENGSAEFAGTPGISDLVIRPEHGWVSVTVQDLQDPRATYGYLPAILNIWAVADDRYLMACPALMGGITNMNKDVGVVAGINRWLP